MAAETRTAGEELADRQQASIVFAELTATPQDCAPLSSNGVSRVVK
jgi:hypothetical protein